MSVQQIKRGEISYINCVYAAYSLINIPVSCIACINTTHSPINAYDVEPGHLEELDYYPSYYDGDVFLPQVAYEPG
jgi:hypothetical protein